MQHSSAVYDNYMLGGDVEPMYTIPDCRQLYCCTESSVLDNYMLGGDVEPMYTIPDCRQLYCCTESSVVLSPHLFSI